MIIYHKWTLSNESKIENPKPENNLTKRVKRNTTPAKKIQNSMKLWYN